MQLYRQRLNEVQRNDRTNSEVGLVKLVTAVTRSSVCLPWRSAAVSGKMPCDLE